MLRLVDTLTMLQLNNSSCNILPGMLSPCQGCAFVWLQTLTDNLILYSYQGGHLLLATCKLQASLP